ncbi:MAG: HlyC/CorC family transporter [Deltaproteobacteria bacterium]|nr:HlyC/CorC family transporter [Deltaproteobacteria bacterium]
MIQSLFEFGDIVAREIMVPRTDMVTISRESTLREVIQLFIQYGHSRLPVYQKDIDDMIGILHLKDLLAYWESPADIILPEENMRRPYFVPEGKKVTDLLAELRARKIHMAIVLDEYGGTAGLVTLEDIIEEIVGEIHDEYDHDDQRIIRLRKDAILVDARLNLEDLADFLGVKFPEGNYDSVGGFIIDLTGKVPQEDEQIKYLDLMMIVRSADARRISQIEIKRLDQTDPLTAENP